MASLHDLPEAAEDDDADGPTMPVFIRHPASRGLLAGRAIGGRA